MVDSRERPSGRASSGAPTNDRGTPPRPRASADEGGTATVRPVKSPAAVLGATFDPPTKPRRPPKGHQAQRMRPNRKPPIGGVARALDRAFLDRLAQEET